MVDDGQVQNDLAKSRKGIVAALLAILLVIATIVGVAYFMELGPFAADEPAQNTPQQPAPSQDETSTTEPTATPTVQLPPQDAQEVMYWEQVASAEQIADLVDDKFASFTLGQIATNANTADVRVTATYRDGSTLSGWMLLRQYNDAWYFSMITRDGNTTATSVSGSADVAVAKAMAEGNAANQEIPLAITKGEFTTMSVDKVTKGSGTAIIDVTFSGTGAPVKGQITCISKDVNGTSQWFVTGFAKS